MKAKKFEKEFFEKRIFLPAKKKKGFTWDREGLFYFNFAGFEQRKLSYLSDQP